jgi:hypothetical protein
MENERLPLTDEEIVIKAATDEDLSGMPAAAQRASKSGNPYAVRRAKLLPGAERVVPLSGDLSFCRISIKITIFLTFLSMPAYFFLTPTSHGPAVLRAIPSIMMFLTGLATMAAGCLVMRFMHRARRNLNLCGTPGLKHGLNWTIFGWFVPIVSAFMPCMVLGEIWKASKSKDGSTDWKKEKLPREFYVWWTLWLVSGFVMSVVTPLMMLVGLLHFAMGAAMCIKGVVETISALALLKILNEINHRQMHKFPVRRG